MSYDIERLRRWGLVCHDQPDAVCLPDLADIEAGETCVDIDCAWGEWGEWVHLLETLDGHL
jgi:hypothetical protein